jgi:hypothetical protein
VRGNQRLVLVLAVIGLIEAVQYTQKLHSGSVAIVALAGSLVLAAAFGAARAATVRIWMQDGQPWVQGNLLTAALWVVALAAHLGYDYLVGQHKDIGGIGGATLVLYLAVSLGVQRAIVMLRAQRLDPATATSTVASAASRLQLGHRRPRAGHVEEMVDGVMNEVPRERVNRE